ncbi:unnamed protein product, partial [Angiostrongylus costaricensis]|uniref:Protein kinase domain-containing protein n=1 Tax=Angiostrongylus costaricensis TaxID=334426 RepID=A0A158PEZ0_ANGCS
SLSDEALDNSFEDCTTICLYPIFCNVREFKGLHVWRNIFPPIWIEGYIILLTIYFLFDGGWLDPLPCVWCSNDERHFVTSVNDKFSCFQPLVGVCPPVVDHVDVQCLGLTMGRFNHPHLMQLIGIAFADGRIPIIVTDYMENGDLRSYLRDISKVFVNNELFTFFSIYVRVTQFSLCVDYRLDSDLNIKIGDFGLCRRVSDESECYKPSHKHRDVPFPWMAPEAMRIVCFQFTFQNDVWAYGVVLWELTTRGLMPYAGKNGIEILEFLRAGNRLEMPEYCPLELYNEIMLPCWHADPQQRPTFADLVTLMNNLVASMESSQLNRLSCNYEKVSSAPQLSGIS